MRPRSSLHEPTNALRQAQARGLSPLTVRPTARIRTTNLTKEEVFSSSRFLDSRIAEVTSEEYYRVRNGLA